VPDTITRIADAMQSVLDDVPEREARSAGFLRRRRKLTPAAFTKTLVFGFLADPHASRDQLTRVAATLGAAITPQALDERLTPGAAEMLRRVLGAGIEAMVAADPVPMAILGRFTEVVVLDSSTISLPEGFASRWPGCGTKNPEKGNAAVKMSLALDLRAGRLRGPSLEAGRLNDKRTALADEPLPAGSLRIADLGYFKIAALRRIGRDGAYYLSRYQAGTVIRDRRGRRWARLSEFLEGRGARVDEEVRLGERDRLRCRLLAARVPESVARRRVERLEEEAAGDGRNLSAECVALACWTVFVTNVPPAKLDVDEALALGRSRWQIELLFKLWKSHGAIDEWRSTKPAAIECELYAKLIAMVVQHWVALASGWEHVDRSLVKVCQTIRRYAWSLAAAVGHRPEVRRIIEALRAIVRTGCRINKRRKHPSTFQRLLDPLVGGVT
jgi:hypothetical protein